jgi:hypothetical protein
MLCDLPTVQQAAVGDGLSFDPFPFDQNGLAPPALIGHGLCQRPRRCPEYGGGAALVHPGESQRQRRRSE